MASFSEKKSEEVFANATFPASNVTSLLFSYPFYSLIIGLKSKGKQTFLTRPHPQVYQMPPAVKIQYVAKDRTQHHLTCRGVLNGP